MKIIKLFDLFPERVELNVNSKGMKKSALGGLLSLSLVCFFILVIYYKFYDWLLYRKPSIIIEEKSIKGNPGFFLKRSDSQFMFSLWDWTGDLFNQYPLYVNSEMFKQYGANFKLFGYTGTTYGKYVNCNNTHTSKDLTDYYRSAGSILFSPESWVCLKLNTSEGQLIRLGGDFFVGQVQYAVFSNFTFDLCAVNPVHCRNLSVLKDLQYTLQLSYIDHYFDADNQEKGFQRYINTQFTNIDVTSRTRIIINYIENVVITSKNIFFDEYVETKFPSIESYHQMALPYDLIEKNSTSMVEFIIRSTSKKRIITRTYPQLSEFMAGVGAYFSFLINFCYLLLKLANFGSIEFSVMKHSYNANSAKPEETVCDKLLISTRSDRRSAKKSTKLCTQKRNNFLLIRSEIATPSKIPNVVDSETHRVTMTGYDAEKFIKGEGFKKHWFSVLVYGYLGCCKIKSFSNLTLRNHLFGRQIVKQDMNVALMIRRINTIEKLLRILFTKEQMDIIKNIHNREVNPEMDIEEYLSNIKKLFVPDPAQSAEFIINLGNMRQMRCKKNDIILELLMESSSGKD